MAALEVIMDALASQIDAQIGSRGTADALIEHLQVDGKLVRDPTPPSIDIFPAEEFQQPLAFGHPNNEIFLNVRARVTTADHEGGQALLLSLMDPESDESLAGAIWADKTLGGQVEKAIVSSGPSGYGFFPNAFGQIDGSLLGCNWTVRIFP